MKRTSFWAALLAASPMVVVITTIGLAAPPAQNPTLTATPTPTGYGPTPTATTTLRPLPQGAGRVSTHSLAVRTSPDFDAAPLGQLRYDEEVHPIGRSISGNWVVINWEGKAGWILASLVKWDPSFDINSLPTLRPPLTLTPILETPSATVQATDAATETSAPVQPSATPTLTQEPIATKLSATATPAAIAQAPISIPTDPAVQPSSAPPQLSFPVNAILPWLGIGVPLVLIALYGWQLSLGMREVKRYAKTFPLERCPVCQVGFLTLDETIQRPLGIAHVHRIVRCNSCRSVLRQVEPGVWRYSIDPSINPDLAKEYNGRQFTDDELRYFPATASAYAPQAYNVNPDAQPPLTDEEILAELEARIPPPEEPMEMEAPSAEASENPIEESPAEEPPTE